MVAASTSTRAATRLCGSLTGVLPPEAGAVVSTYLDRVDRALPGRVEGFYVVGSTAQGAFRPGRSDVDFVALVPDGLTRDELRRLRLVHRRQFASTLVRAVTRFPGEWARGCNGVYVRWTDFTRSSLDVHPIASHVAGKFEVGRGFDVNPVTWHLLSEHGIVVRGPEPGRLDVFEDEAELRTWTLRNLNGYWRRWALAAGGFGLTAAKTLLRHSVAWGVLGAPRLHYTLETGGIATKEQAGEYALETFDPRWHPLINEALTYWRGGPAAGPYRHPASRRRAAAAFVMTVIEDANARAS